MVRANFEIKQTSGRGGVALTIDGELDMHTIGQLCNRVAEQLDHGATELTLDLRELTFMDSSGLRQLIELYDRSRADGWRLALLYPRQEAAALVLHCTGADRALPFVESADLPIERSQDVTGDDDGSMLRLELAGDDEAPALARAAVLDFCKDRNLSSGTLAALALLISEIVTNAVIHPEVDATSLIELFAQIDDETIRVEVSDDGDGFVPAPRDPDRSTGGYGLCLVQDQAKRWGVERTPRTIVWFELAVQPAG